jgi:hypothetical protein
VGNKRFRDAVAAALPEYIKSDNRYDKSLVVRSIVNDIKQAGGRFLKYNFTTKTWCELNDQQAKEKVGHAVRDAETVFQRRKNRKNRHMISKDGTRTCIEKSPPVTSNLQQAFANLSTSLHRQSASEPQHAHAIGHIQGVQHEFITSPDEAPSAVTTHHSLEPTQHSQGGDPHDHFLAAIDSVLGPLPPDASDPMQSVLDDGHWTSGNYSAYGPH